MSILLHKRIADKNENLPGKCVNFGIFCPKRRQFQHPNTRVLLKFALSLRKIPTLPKAGAEIVFHKHCLWCRGWRDAFFDFRDEIEILLPSVSCLETRSRFFFFKISGFETRLRFLFTESQASRRDRDFLSFDLEIRDEIEIF